jgi:MFS superfamily sulfate permease-like transporter
VEELNTAGWSTLVFSLVGTTQFGILGLLIYNAFALCAFWPFFAAIVAAILIATLQFVRLLFSERRSIRSYKPGSAKSCAPASPISVPDWAALRRTGQ